jgi:hypothetical protein
MESLLRKSIGPHAVEHLRGRKKVFSRLKQNCGVKMTYNICYNCNKLYHDDQNDYPQIFRIAC